MTTDFLQHPWAGTFFPASHNIPAGSDGSWDNTDCNEKCVGCVCFEPRKNRGRFRPWVKKMPVVKTEERGKKEQKRRNTPRRSKSNTPKTQNPVRITTIVHVITPKQPPLCLLCP
ncbi:hypothetical protein PAXRUDRAFT_154814 [Paxillus rubicundulus Ve08.2h10]|uniref:Unplaced genomic scaffold scaffold_877, whole genome shotgun sequence n=1 Tax=Paxillus rubicundulus Ve08.2h10 TaxID=930991 RepID=A0A0D0DCP0_9AGAM|nr:hypothetical protein PAXRUDRAFT_154814 [Paxillus rubicundulus Ve08.2h10]